MEENIKPCPFCGFTFLKHKFEEFSSPKDGTGKSHWMYECLECKTQFCLPLRKTEKETLKFWNKRYDLRN